MVRRAEAQGHSPGRVGAVGVDEQLAEAADALGPLAVAGHVVGVGQQSHARVVDAADQLGPLRQSVDDVALPLLERLDGDRHPACVRHRPPALQMPHELLKGRGRVEALPAPAGCPAEPKLMNRTPATAARRKAVSTKRSTAWASTAGPVVGSSPGDEDVHRGRGQAQGLGEPQALREGGLVLLRAQQVVHGGIQVVQPRQRPNP